jgi:hypothetical protein
MEPVRTEEEKIEMAEPRDVREVAVGERATPPPRASHVPAAAAGPAPEGGELLLPAQRREELRRAWLEIQSSFIDEPPEAVRKADGLVKELLHSVAERFESARGQLEGEWQRGEGVNTESLRLAFRRYRALFDRLLSF